MKIEDTVLLKVLVFDTKPSILHSIANSLEKSCLSTCRYTDENQAMENLESDSPKIFIIGPSVQKMRAIEFGMNIRDKKNFADSGIIYIISFDQRKDDYMIVDGFVEFVYSPIMHNRLIDVVKCLIRTTKPELESRYLEYKNIKFYKDTGETKFEDRNIFISGLEAKILETLLTSPKTVFTREDLIKNAWKNENKDEICIRTVDVHINRLRKMLREKLHVVELIKTVRSNGYCISLSEKD